MRCTNLCTALLACVVLATSCGPAGGGPVAEPTATKPGEIPFEVAGPGGMAIVVPVHINGKGPYNFVVDTGATFTSVDAALADELGLQAKPGAIGFGSGVGGSGSMRIVEIDSLEVGSASAKDVTAAVLDLSGFKKTGVDVNGLLGLNFLKNYRATFDFERSVLSLDTPGEPERGTS